jgi:hypothetical protein
VNSPEPDLMDESDMVQSKRVVVIVRDVYNEGQ